jgi:DNA-binding ferritin-like protein
MLTNLQIDTKKHHFVVIGRRLLDEHGSAEAEYTYAWCSTKECADWLAAHRADAVIKA